MPTTTTRRHATRIWVLLGLILLTVNLRAAITCTGPLLTDIQHTRHLTGLQLSILTTLPVLCLGAFAAWVPALARRTGTEPAITGALLLIAVGITLRGLPCTTALFAGTIIAGAGIATGNVLVPAVVKERFAQQIGRATGLAMTLMASSGAVAAGMAVPVGRLAGWQAAMAVWAAPAAAGAALWAVLATRHHGPGSGSGPRRPAAARHEGSLLRSPLAWAVATFLGIVSLMFYALAAWLPEIMQADGYSKTTAGAMVSVMLTLGIPMGYVMPVIAARLPQQQPLVLALAAIKITSLAGILTMPSLAWMWVCVLGLATGSAFPLAMTLLTLRSPNPAVAARLSGMAQTFGYLLAGTGPASLGLLHTLTDTWQIPLLLLVALVVPETAAGLVAARPLLVDGPTPAAAEPAREKTCVS
ncbi:MFS transporter [Streptomyces sp. NPDC053493]|uniref:MFS transporter n=1 Tax=Streptomyces sp. NPDC053493 TaxID=3365705 RepID=UPI0037D940CD